MATFDSGVFDSGALDALYTSWVADVFTVDAAITNASAFQNTAFQHDAFQVGPPPGTGEIPVRAMLLRTAPGSFTVAAWFAWRIYASTTVSAWISGKFPLNAVLLKTQEFTSASTPPSNLTLDYRWGPGGSFAVNAILKALMSSGDAFGDVAQGKYATGWDLADGGGPASAVDGNDGTFWGSRNGATMWIKIDLADRLRIISIRLLQSSNSYHQRSGAYLRYSDDNSTWTIAGSWTGLTTDQTLTVSSPGWGRYWQLIDTDGYHDGGWWLYTLNLNAARLSSLTLDAMFSRGHFTLDSWLWIGNANLRFSQTGFEAARSGNPNALLSQSGFEVAREKPRGLFTTDAVLSIITNPTGTFTVGAWLRGWGSYTLDAWLWTGDAGVRVSQFGYQRARTAVIVNTRVSQAGIQVARGGFPGDVASQVGIQVAYEKPKGTFGLSAAIYRPGSSMTPATFTVDAFKVFIIHLNAVLTVPTEDLFRVRAAIVRNITGTFTLDANVQLGFLLDAVIIVPQPAVFTLFAYKVVKTTGAGSLTLDAFKSCAFTVGAWITKPRPFTVDAAVIEDGKYLKSFYADAVVASFARAGEFLLEAEIWTQRTVVYEGEGSSHVERNLVTDHLSIPGFRSPVSDVNGIYGPFYPIDSYPVTLTIYDLQPAGDLIDDRSVGVHAADETNLWSYYTGPGAYTFWPVNYFIEHYVYTWPGPFNPAVTGSGMVSFWRDDTVIDALPAPTLDAWIVGTPGEPFTLDAEIVELEKRWSFLLDAELSRIGEKRGRATLDAFIVGRVEGVFHAFAEIAALHFLAEAIIRIPSFTLDAHIHLMGGADATFVVDAVVKATMSWYPLGPALDAVIVRHTNYSAYALDAELVAVNDRRGLMRLDALIVATRPAKRFYLAALIIPDVSFSVAAYIGHRMTVDAWIGSIGGGMGGFPADAYIRGSSIIVFPEVPDARVVTDAVLSGTTLTSSTADFTFSDTGRTVTGPGIPPGTTIVAVINSTTVIISQPASSGTGVTVTIGSGGPTDPYGGPPAIARKFAVKIEAFIPDPIPVGNDQYIEELIMKILEAEAELDALYCAVEHYSSQGYPVAGGRNSYGGGYTGSLPNAISQIGYPGAGDIDDCWVVATVWAAIASGQTFQPTVPQFRAWAQNPDRPGATGGTLDHIMRGARGAWPGAGIRRYASSDWNGFISLLKAGWTASLAVRSSALPSNLQYGFSGLHQIGVAYSGGSYVIMNPLQSTGSSLHTISGDTLRTAARGFTGGTICACMFR